MKESYAAILLLLCSRLNYLSSFQIPDNAHLRSSVCIASLAKEDTVDSFVDSFSYDEVDDGKLRVDLKEKKRGLGAQRWANLNPAIKERIVKEGQEKAIMNKKKREPKEVKKRRLYMNYKDMLQKEKKERYVVRKTPLTDPERVNLRDLNPKESYTGQVISLKNFGAYVDIGSEVDGLLHVSQISREQFVRHPREILSLGDEVEVRVVRASPEMKKLQLTMLPESVLEEEAIRKNFEDDEDDERIQLDEVFIDDELWGEIRRVTDYGAYVELGAVVRGFLHFMDHPMWEDHKGSPPSEFMKLGDRVRVWVSGVDTTQKRIKLTANRPDGLPGPRREIKWI
eukprot:scaffold29791_cov70-Cyclotella_meneghiniana.AAC.9